MRLAAAVRGSTPGPAWRDDDACIVLPGCTGRCRLLARVWCGQCRSARMRRRSRALGRSRSGRGPCLEACGWAGSCPRGARDRRCPWRSAPGRASASRAATRAVPAERAWERASHHRPGIRPRWQGRHRVRRGTRDPARAVWEQERLCRPMLGSARPCWLYPRRARRRPRSRARCAVGC